MKPIKSLLSAACVVSLAAAGCVAKQDPPPSAIAKAIPTNDQVAIKLPQNAMLERQPTGPAGEPGHVQGATPTIGQLAAFYVITRGVTSTFNGGTAWVLILVHTIVQFPVTSVAGNVYTWGPWSGNALDPAIYKLDVTANADGTFDYVLSGHAKSDTTNHFLAIIDGHAVPAANDLGNGTFTVDFDAARTVDPVANANNKGQVDVTYDLAQRHIGMQITSTDANGQPVSAEYAYDQGADGSGDMTFDVLANLGGTAAEEDLTIRSRWLATGAGRADARIAGGDLGSQTAIASECWSTAFLETYYTDSVNFLPTAGDPTTCAYQDVSLPPAR